MRRNYLIPDYSVNRYIIIMNISSTEAKKCCLLPNETIIKSLVRIDNDIQINARLSNCRSINTAWIGGSSSFLHNFRLPSPQCWSNATCSTHTMSSGNGSQGMGHLENLATLLQ